MLICIIGSMLLRSQLNTTIIVLKITILKKLNTFCKVCGSVLDDTKLTLKCQMELQ